MSDRGPAGVKKRRAGRVAYRLASRLTRSSTRRLTRINHVTSRFAAVGRRCHVNHEPVLLTSHTTSHSDPSFLTRRF